MNEKQIQAAIRRCAKETTINDGAEGRGGGSLRLRLRPTAAGVTATWLAFWKQDDKRGSKQLGRYPDMTLADAREKFRAEIRPLLLVKKNPRVAAPTADKPTVENLFKRYVEHLRANGTRSVDEIERVLLTGAYSAADALGRQRLAGSIEAADARQPLVQASKRGALRSADVQRTYMASAFSWGMKSANDYTTEHNYDWGVKLNPVSAIPKDARAKKARDRNLSADEVKAVWHAAPDQTGDVLRLVIACGQRILETIRVDGCEIDLAGKVWNMPAHKTKGGEHPHSIPLPRQAVEIFTRLISLYGDGPLFPSREGAKGPRIGVASVSRSAARLDCCKPFQARDLRRTWKSRAGDAGVDRFIRDLIQQHAQGDTGSVHYDHTDYMPRMRAAMTVWEMWLDNNVVEIQQLDMAA